MAYLPPELIEKILDRVPKKSLLRFRCVSKPWRRLIDSRFEFPFCRAWRLYLFPMVSSRLYCIDLHPRGDMVEIENPLGWVRFVLLGSCYRLICISNWGDGQLAIWNVTTGKSDLLPPADTEIPHGFGLFVYGFGLRDDYNRNSEFVLLRIAQTSREPIVSEVSIYRKTDNKWTRLQELPYFLLEPGRMGVLSFSRLYWIMRRKGEQNSAKVLVAFDIFQESFVEVNLPNDIDNRLRMDLAVLRGCLCLTIYGKAGVGKAEVVDVWILKRNQWIRPWDLLFSLRDCRWGFQSVRPFSYDSDGHRVLVQVSSTTFCWYNLHIRGIEPFNINGVPTSFEEATCLQVRDTRCANVL